MSLQKPDASVLTTHRFVSEHICGASENYTDITKFELTPMPITSHLDNIAKDERESRVSLKIIIEFRIKEAVKSNAIVVIDIDHYIPEAMRQLNST